MGFFDLLRRKNNYKNNNIDNVTKIEGKIEEKDNKPQNGYEIYKYDESTKEMMKNSRFCLVNYDAYKQKDRDLNKEQVRKLTDGMKRYLADNGIPMHFYTQNNENANKKGSNFRPYNHAFNCDTNNDSPNRTLSEMGAHEVQYHMEHSQTGTLGDLTDPNKTMEEWFDKAYNRVDGHLRDDASRSFDNYMKQQEDTWNNW